MDVEIRKTLKDILEYIGVDTTYAGNATLQTYIERLIKKVKIDKKLSQTKAHKIKWKGIQKANDKSMGERQRTVPRMRRLD